MSEPMEENKKTEMKDIVTCILNNWNTSSNPPVNPTGQGFGGLQ